MHRAGHDDDSMPSRIFQNSPSKGHSSLQVGQVATTPRMSSKRVVIRIERIIVSPSAP